MPREHSLRTPEFGERKEAYWYKLYDPDTGRFFDDLGEFANTYEYTRHSIFAISPRGAWEFVEGEHACDKAKCALEMKPNILSTIAGDRLLLIEVRNEYGNSPSLEEQLRDPHQDLHLKRTRTGVKITAIHYMAIL